METREELTIRLTFSRKSALPLLALFFLCWHPAFIASESLTLTTYYPAPYGGYVSLLTTGNTILARDGGVGTTVAVGSGSPTSKFHIFGGGNTSIDMKVNGRIQTGDANGNGGMWLNSANDGFVGNTGGNIGFWTSGVGWNALQIVKANGRVGIGTASPDRLLHVAGDAHISRSLQVDGDITVGSRILSFCSSVGYSASGVANCPLYTDYLGVSRRMQVVGFMGDGVARVSGFLPRTQTSSSVGTYVVLGEDWGGAMMCCKL